MNAQHAAARLNWKGAYHAHICDQTLRIRARDRTIIADLPLSNDGMVADADYVCYLISAAD